MTRFARARGSKSSNERVPDEATPWNVMKMQLEDSQASSKAVTQKAKSAKQLLAEKDELFYHNNAGNVNHEWATFDDISESTSGKDKTGKAQNSKESKKKNKKKIAEAAKIILSTEDSNNDTIVEVVDKGKLQKENNNKIISDEKSETSPKVDNVGSKRKKSKKSQAIGGMSDINSKKPTERGNGDENNIDDSNSNPNCKDTLSDKASERSNKNRVKTSKKSKSHVDTGQMANHMENVTSESKERENLHAASVNSNKTEAHSSEVVENSEKLSKRQKRNQKKQKKILSDQNGTKVNVADVDAQKKQGPRGFDVQGNDWSNEVKFGKQSNAQKLSATSSNDGADQSQIFKEQNEKISKKRINYENKEEADGALPDGSNPDKPKAQNDNNTQNNKSQKRKGGKNDNKEHKRRKPDEGVVKMIINGNEVEVVKYDGFPVKKEDADRLQELKKNMIIKGIPRSEINIAMKLERRKAEKALARERKRVCFHCRKSGHNLSDCPELGRDEAGSGICFKCGSAEHTHFECKVVKGQEFRHASCFICREQGHIARQCPDNPKGLYPQGGGCKICGDVTHLKKDCPDLIKEKEETNITADKIVSGQLESLEEDAIHTNRSNADNKPKSKIIKF